MEYSRDELVDSVPQAGFFGHPKGLGILFFIEFWERFSYYGMRAILLYYMYYSVEKGGLGFSKDMASSMFSVYGSLIFMTGIIGGWLADRVLGSRKSLFLGAILIMFGHIALSLPGSRLFFLVSMFFIIIGSGLMKPNISSVVGDLYHKEDARMDAGFVIFYLSVNMGALISPFIVGQLQTSYGFHYGFGAAAFGMFLALIIYLIFNKKNLGLIGKRVPNPLTEEEKRCYLRNLIFVFIICGILLYILYLSQMLTFNNFTYFVTFLGIAIPIYYFTMMYRSKKTTMTEKSRVLAYIPLFIAGVMFWSIQEQGSSILGVFADTNTQLDLKNVVGIDFVIPASFFQSINPIFIVLFAPLISTLWVKLGKRNPSTGVKFSLGLLFAGVSFLVMMIPTRGMTDTTLINPAWLVLSFVICVIGELCLSPVGSSVSVKLAPRAFESQMLSLWFLTDATAQAINSQLVKVYDVMTKAQYFGFLGALAVILGLVMMFYSPWIQKKMQGIL